MLVSPAELITGKGEGAAHQAERRFTCGVEGARDNGDPGWTKKRVWEGRGRGRDRRAKESDSRHELLLPPSCRLACFGVR